VRERGIEAVIHGNSGRHPANYTAEGLRAEIIRLKKSAVYSSFNITYFREMLEEREGIRISYSTLRTILKEAGVPTKRKHTGEKQFRRRPRREHFGEMLQADATPYDWFGSGERSALHGFIDDGTGKITGLYLCRNECLAGYLEVMRKTLTKYGVPMDFYSDKAGIFVVTTKKRENWTEEEIRAGRCLDKTQFGKIAEQLGINMIHANTPQAKGRIERLWGTLQDRLTSFFTLEGIRNIDDANAILPKFIRDYNRRFAKKAVARDSYFIPLSKKEDLDKILTVRFERTTDACGCFSFQNYTFQIDADGHIPAKKKIVFLFSEKIGFQALLGSRYYPVTLLGYVGKRKSNLPEVTKFLLDKYYHTDVKRDPSGGEIFPCDS
jgi:transposase InsO family protein